jgi:hypothetical protein
MFVRLESTISLAIFIFAALGRICTALPGVRDGTLVFALPEFWRKL